MAYTMHTSVSKSTTTFNESSEGKTLHMLGKAHPLQHRLQSYWQDHVPNNHTSFRGQYIMAIQPLS